MNDLFLTNYSSERFVDRLKKCFSSCSSFRLTVSFIKEAGLKLIEKEMEEAIERGVKGYLITSTYQNFTDIPSLRKFLSWQEKYPNFLCRLDDGCFSDNGYHSKGYLFEIDGKVEFLVGSTNITRFALLKNIEWNVSLLREKKDPLVVQALKDFDYLYDRTLPLTEERIRLYTIALDYAIEKWDMDYDAHYDSKQIMPNAMQRKALKELRRYRDMGVDKALIVAATASGKTYLAAFDARNFDAKRVLFIVHRDTILSEAKKTFQKVFLSRRTYGLYTGNENELGADFLFSTNTMMASHLDQFDPEEFDYIVFDECHHITASTYQKILSYFRPRFLLGLTATPERMDNQDVFAMFDKNVPYELRLRDAIRNELVVPFKYYGVRDTFVDYSAKDKSRFLSEYYAPEHCEFIAKEIEARRPEGKLKAVAFCRSIEHAQLMAHAMSELGYCTTALTGANKTGERIKAFTDLQDEDHPLEIVFAVDILNEGVDIPGINMVLFLRPTESSTIFIQQLGRGLRKTEGKDYLTVLDFIGNSYDRSIQIAFALGSLSQTTYLEKALVSSLVRDDFRALGVPGVEVHIDELSKEEILSYIDKTNFNNLAFLKQDYFNFKKYLLKETFPDHVEYLNSDCAPDLMRFMKSKANGKKNSSYYNFLKAIDEDVPPFTEEEVCFLERVSDQLPLTRREEYLLLSSLFNSEESQTDFRLLSSRITNGSLKSAKENLVKQKICVEKGDELALNLPALHSDSFDAFVHDLLRYGLERYEEEFGEFVGTFKRYANYPKDKIILEIDGKQAPFMQGTKYDVDKRVTYIFVGLKKDEVVKGNFQYKDHFLSPNTFQWESVNNTTFQNAEGIKLMNTETVHLFVRKMDSEDGVTLPFTYFGTGKFARPRASENGGKPTLMFDIVLDHPVPEEYWFDFQIPELKRA